MGPPARPALRADHLPTLDGWRAVAIAMVLLDHGGDGLLRLIFGAAFDSAHYAYLKNPLGRGGVHLFFALSGYLITMRLLSEERRHGQISLPAFYLRRLFRIQPAALCFLLTLAIMGSAGLVSISPVGWWSALLAAANYTLPQHTWYTEHFWSLAVEEHFYLLWPTVFVLLSPRHRLGGALALALIGAAWWTVVLSAHVTESPFLWVRTDIEAPWLLWGCIAALALRHRIAGEWLARLARPGTGVLVPLALALASATLIYTRLDWRVDLAATLLCAAATPLAFISTSSHPQAWLARFLELKPVAWLGRVSYGVYLWQQLFFVWDGQRSAAMMPWQSFPWQLLATLGIAALSYYFLEQPLIRAGRNLGARPARAVVPARLPHG
ncbi:MAG: acyltransferase [Gammaproteobacteria bacterium]|nr:acyltransferase [Gammaproteobacteria bacterium]